MDTGSPTAGDSSATMAEIFDAQSKNNNGIFRVSMCGGTQELEQISRDGSQYSLTTAILPSLGARSNRRVKLRNFIISPYDRRYRFRIPRQPEQPQFEAEEEQQFEDAEELQMEEKALAKARIHISEVPKTGN